MADPTMKNGGVERKDLQLMDVAPTILNSMGLRVPSDMEGKIITWNN